MKPDARAFLQKWISEKVNFKGYLSEAAPDPTEKEVVEQCVIEAKLQGISREELEKENGPLEEAIQNWLVQLADQEFVDFNAEDPDA